MNTTFLSNYIVR